MEKLDLLKKAFENNVKVMCENWVALLQASLETDNFIEKSSYHLDTSEGRAADSLWWMMDNEFDKLHKQYRKELWDLYKNYCSFPVDDVYTQHSSKPVSWVDKNPEDEQIIFYTATFELFEKWINIINDKSTQHKIIVKSTLHTLDMTLLTK